MNKEDFVLIKQDNNTTSNGLCINSVLMKSKNPALIKYVSTKGKTVTLPTSVALLNQEIHNIIASKVSGGVISDANFDKLLNANSIKERKQSVKQSTKKKKSKKRNKTHKTKKHNKVI